MPAGISAQRTVVQLLLIAFIGVLVYSNTLNAPFVFDDEPNIVDNPVIRDFDIFKGAAHTKHIRMYKGVADFFGTRHMGFFTFAVNYRLHGLDVSGYHVFNISTHLINALLVYWLVLLTFRTPYMTARHDRESTGEFHTTAAFLSALVFAVHPVQTQAVTYIVQRFTSLATLFYLLALTLYTRSRLSNSTAARWGIYAVAFLSAILAMKTKEISFTLPVVIVIYELMFFTGKKGKRLLYLLPLLLTMLIIPLSLVGGRGGTGGIDDAIKLASSGDASQWNYFITQFRVAVTYVRLLLLPINQNLDYDYPVYRSFSDPPVLSSFLLLASFLGVGIYLLRRSGLSRVMAFGIFWFFITLSVESSIIPIDDVIFEHRLYLPSVGFIMGAVVCLMTVAKRWGSSIPYMKKIAGTGALLVTLTLAGATYARNAVWQDTTALWEDVVRKSPGKARGHDNLAVLYKEQGRLVDALMEFQAALRIKPDLDDAHNNLGVIYLNMRLFDKAIEKFQAALHISPYHSSAHSNLGLAYFNKGDLVQAERELKAALLLNPDHADAHYNLGLLYEQQRRSGEAKKEYRVAFKINPLLVNSYNNSGVELFRQGKLDSAILRYRTVVELKPGLVQAHYNLGLTLAQKGLLDEAAETFRSAIRLNPDLERAYYNLGLILERQGRYSEAAQELEIALKIKPDDPDTLRKYEADYKRIKAASGRR